MSAKHMVKCLYCEHYFDSNEQSYIKVNKTRYAHKECYEQEQKKQQKQAQDKIKLEQYIKQLFGYQILPTRVVKQIKDYVKINKFTYSGILSTLKYFFEIKGNNIEKANGGIGIVKYVYDDARRYYISLLETKNKNTEIIKRQQVEEIPIKEIYIIPPRREPMKRIRKLFTFLEEEE